MSIAEASARASRLTGTDVTHSNIQYLLKYNRLPAHKTNGISYLRTSDLDAYFRARNRRRETLYKSKLGSDINWYLSFDQFRESETTKHVHLLHLNKGKFFPQLIKYFLDGHVDEFKTETTLEPGDIVLDPFCGSGTTLIQANELGIHAIGIEVSAFNSLISNLKLADVKIEKLTGIIGEISSSIEQSESGYRVRRFEDKLLKELKNFNTKHFPAPKFLQKIKKGEIDKTSYCAKFEQEFRESFRNLIR